MVSSGKKLLVLDINGLLLDTYFQGEARPDRPHDAKVNRFYVYKRAFCEEFIQFSLQNFIVGVWSSAREHNVLSLVDFMFKEAKEKLAFIWHQEHCTDTGVRHPDNKFKPVFLKELSKLWEKFEADLPWAKGDYGPSNTLLIDDSPYKAISNPRHTAIFPKTYKATDPDDNFLAGELLPYLEGLLEAKNVQSYIQNNPIGESSISPSDPQWSQILKSDQFKNEVPAHSMALGPHMISSNHWMSPNSLFPGTGGAAPQLVGAEPQIWNAGHRGKRLKRYDPIDHYDVGTFDSQAYARDLNDRGAVASRHTPRDVRDDRIRKIPMRSSLHGNISREADRPHNVFLSHKRYDQISPVRDYRSRASGLPGDTEFPKDEVRDCRRGSSRDLEGADQEEDKRKRRRRNSALSEEQEFPRDEPRDRHRGRSRDVEGTYQVEGNLRRSSVRYYRSRATVSSEEPDIPRDEPRDRHRGSSRARGGTYQGEGKRKTSVKPRRERSIDSDEEHCPCSSERRSPPRHDNRREESQSRSKPREGRELQRYNEKKLPRKRHLSLDSGRHHQKYDQGGDRARQRSSRRKSGR